MRASGFTTVSSVTRMREVILVGLAFSLYILAHGMGRRTLYGDFYCPHCSKNGIKIIFHNPPSFECEQCGHDLEKNE